MFKKMMLSLAAAAAIAAPTQAADFSGVVQLVFPCSDGWYEVQLEGVTAPWQNATRSIRFMMKNTNIGPERMKQHYTAALTSLATGSSVWFGTVESAPVGGNCGTGNLPAYTVAGMSIFR